MNLLYLIFNLMCSEKIIKNINFPSCRNCIHFKPNSNYKFTSVLNKCHKFGEKNIITDEITYQYADSCRLDESKCGKEGLYFEEEKNIELKILKHNIVSKSSNYFLILGFILLYRIIII